MLPIFCSPACNVDDNIIKIGGIKEGKESNGLSVDCQIIFFLNREKVVCHFYNTTQRILVNGHGYRSFINIFLKPFFTSKIDSSLTEIQAFNDMALDKLGNKSVKRSTVKYKGGTPFTCKSCDFAAKSISALNKHKKTEHSVSFNGSLSLRQHPQSTRNNSVIECLMLEDVSATNLSSDAITLDLNVLRYTCGECNIRTTSKTQMDHHVEKEHTPDANEEVIFSCHICTHDFKKEDDLNAHMKTHDTITPGVDHVEVVVDVTPTMKANSSEQVDKDC